MILFMNGLSEEENINHMNYQAKWRSKKTGDRGPMGTFISVKFKLINIFYLGKNGLLKLNNETGAE